MRIRIIDSYKCLDKTALLLTTLFTMNFDRSHIFGNSKFWLCCSWTQRVVEMKWRWYLHSIGRVFMMFRSFERYKNTHRSDKLNFGRTLFVPKWSLFKEVSYFYLFWSLNQCKAWRQSGVIGGSLICQCHKLHNPNFCWMVG